MREEGTCLRSCHGVVGELKLVRGRRGGRTGTSTTQIKRRAEIIAYGGGSGDGVRLRTGMRDVGGGCAKVRARNDWRTVSGGPSRIRTKELGTTTRLDVVTDGALVVDWRRDAGKGSGTEG